MRGSLRARSTPGGQPMSKFFSGNTDARKKILGPGEKILMLSTLVLLLTFCHDSIYIMFIFRESATSKQLREMDIGEYKYLQEIYNGQWQQVCVILPYSSHLSRLPDKQKQALINEKLAWPGVIGSEGLWHLVFFRNAHDDEYLDYITFRMRDLRIRQYPHNSSQEHINYFKQAGFSPAYCAERNQAVMFKYENQWQGDTYMYITLGVINQ